MKKFGIVCSVVLAALLCVSGITVFALSPETDATAEADHVGEPASEQVLPSETELDTVVDLDEDLPDEKLPDEELPDEAFQDGGLPDGEIVGEIADDDHVEEEAEETAFVPFDMCTPLDLELLTRMAEERKIPTYDANRTDLPSVLDLLDISQRVAKEPMRFADLVEEVGFPTAGCPMNTQFYMVYNTVEGVHVLIWFYGENQQLYETSFDDEGYALVTKMAFDPEGGLTRQILIEHGYEVPPLQEGEIVTDAEPDAD